MRSGPRRPGYMDDKDVMKLNHPLITKTAGLIATFVSPASIVPDMPRVVELVARRAWVEAESQGLLDRLFDGRLAPLVTHFSDADKLSDQDIAELKALIERIGK